MGEVRGGLVFWANSFGVYLLKHCYCVSCRFAFRLVEVLAGKGCGWGWGWGGGRSRGLGAGKDEL